MKQQSFFPIFAVVALIAGALIVWMSFETEGNYFSFSTPGSSHTRGGGGTSEISGLEISGEFTNPEPQSLQKGIALPEPEGSEANPEVIKGEKILRFKDREAMRRFMEKASREGFRILSSIDALNALRLGFDDPESLKKLLEGEDVEASDNIRVRLPDLEQLTSDREAVAFRNLAFLGLGVDGIDPSWGQGIKVGILDTGVGYPSTLDGVEILRRSLLSEDGTLDPIHSHGTSVASLIAGRDSLIPGIAPGSELLSFQILDGNGSGDSFTVAQGIIEAVDAGANILNLSLGSFSTDPTIVQAVAYANRHGVVLIAASGNEGINHVSSPARLEGVLAVGAIDGTFQHLAFSNRGPEMGVVAPGYGLYAAQLDGEGPISFTGTSASAAITTGALAALLSVEPHLSRREAAALLVEYANEAGPPGMDDFYGSGQISLQRVLERNTRGIFDVALASHYLSPQRGNDGSFNITVTVQNRGTENMSNARLDVQAGSGRYTVAVPFLKPKERWSKNIPVYPGMFLDGKVTVTSKVSSIRDTRKRNDTLKSILRQK